MVPSEQSLSARRAWIEMAVLCLSCVLLLVALRKESVDRNPCSATVDTSSCLSLSARRAWIEISKAGIGQALDYVALRKESVDRNTALLNSVRSMSVALRKESVDRNEEPLNAQWEYRESLSARRAWIEI